jgi:hypothetical protein
MPLIEDLLRYDTVKSDRCLLTFHRNILSLSSGYKSKPNMEKCDMDIEE